MNGLKGIPASSSEDLGRSFAKLKAGSFKAKQNLYGQF